MRIRRIYIKDFGIFREEKLEGLNENIIVIGGYNRAGKTTFSKLFRYLPFGFIDRDKDMPDSNINHSVSYDIERDQGEIFNVSIEGKKQPVVRGINNDKVVTLEDLFGDIDYFTYKQLFNIGLDELQNTSINGAEEISSMQSVLLGAGFRQVIQIPSILKDIERDSKKIGGKNGSPTTAQFKSYNTEIKEGLKLRDRAKLQVDTYFHKDSLLKEVIEKIGTLKDELQQMNSSKRKLNILKNNFNNYENLEKLEMQLEDLDYLKEEGKFHLASLEKGRELKEEYEKVEYDYSIKKYEFIKGTGENADFKASILKGKDKIKEINENISGISEGIKNYKQLTESCYKLKTEISKKAAELNIKLKDNFEKISAINTDAVEFNKLTGTVEAHKTLISKKKDLENELKNIKVNKEIMSKSAPKKDITDFNVFINRCFYITLLFIILGVGLAFIEFKAGLILGVGSSILGGSFILIYNSSRKAYISNKEMFIKLDALSLSLEEKTLEIQGIGKEICRQEEILDCFRDMLYIEEPISGDIIKDYFIQVRSIKEGIISLSELVGKAAGIKREVERKLSLMVDIIEEYYRPYEEGNLRLIKSDLISNAEEIFSKFKKLNIYIELAENLKHAEFIRESLLDKMESIFKVDFKNKSVLEYLNNYIEEVEKYKKFMALKLDYQLQEKTLINAFKLLGIDSEIIYIKECFKEYVSFDEINEAYENLEKSIKEREEELEKLIVEEQSLRLELHKLYSTEHIEEAERKIYNAKKELLPLAKKYASLKAAEFILKKIQKNFIEETKDSLLREASNYLKEITKGEYVGILPGEDLGNLDFKSVVNGGEILESSEVLSRATKEQLFLSVRLSRIREINPPLPIILDDSFVNFDESHTKEVIKVLGLLSTTNQIFITTCHPRLVYYIGNSIDKVKYIKLQKGRFTECNKEELINYLDIQQE